MKMSFLPDIIMKIIFMHGVIYCINMDAGLLLLSDLNSFSSLYTNKNTHLELCWQDMLLLSTQTINMFLFFPCLLCLHISIDAFSILYITSNPQEKY